MLTAALGLAFGYVYATALEWVVHNLVYHQLGRKLGGAWNFHLKEHHRDTRRGRGVDPAFAQRRWLLSSALTAHSREALGLVVVLLLHTPLLLVAPAVFAALAGMAAYYHYCHWKSHADTEWCKRRLPWHWEHHMSPHLDANYCLTSDWFDRLMGTRVRSPECFEEEPARRRAA